MSPRKAGKEDVAAAKRAVKDAKAAAKAADKEAKAAAKRARKSKRAAARPGRQGGRYVPIEKRLKNQQRERAAGEAAAERARRAAKDVYRLIGFDALYADGIAQVEPGLFSQPEWRAPPLPTPPSTAASSTTRWPRACPTSCASAT